MKYKKVFDERVFLNAEINYILSRKDYLDVEDSKNDPHLQELVARMLRGGEAGTIARNLLIENSLPLLANVVKCYVITQDDNLEYVEQLYSRGYYALIHALNNLKEPLNKPFGKFARNFFNKGIKEPKEYEEKVMNKDEPMDIYDDDCYAARVFNSQEQDHTFCFDFLCEDNLEANREIFMRILRDKEFRIINKMMTDGLTWAEVAEEWGENPHTIRKQYTTAVRKIRNYTKHINLFQRITL